jgi:hypothetical protein
MSSQVTARFKTYVDYKSAESDSHIATFRGIKTGIMVTIMFFWIPFIVIYHLFGWMYLIACGLALMAVFSLLGLISRLCSLYGLPSTRNPRQKPFGHEDCGL